MKKMTLVVGFVGSLLSMVAHAQAQVWHMTHGLDHALLLASTVFSCLTILLSILVYALPEPQVDLDRLEKERANRDAEREEKTRHLQLRRDEDAVRRHEAETRKIQTEAARWQLLYEEDQRRLQRNARARDRRRQERGLPPEATSVKAELPPESVGECGSALDLILADDDDDPV